MFEITTIDSGPWSWVKRTGKCEEKGPSQPPSKTRCRTAGASVLLRHVLLLLLHHHGTRVLVAPYHVTNPLMHGRRLVEGDGHRPHTSRRWWTSRKKGLRSRYTRRRCRRPQVERTRCSDGVPRLLRALKPTGAVGVAILRQEAVDGELGRAAPGSQEFPRMNGRLEPFAGAISWRGAAIPRTVL